MTQSQLDTFSQLLRAACLAKLALLTDAVPTAQGAFLGRLYRLALDADVPPTLARASIKAGIKQALKSAARP